MQALSLNTFVNFRHFITEADQTMSDVRKTLEKLPKSHQKFVKPFKFKFQAGNTLKGDGGHVGCIDDGKMTLTVAAPWNYGREFTFLHEIGHLIWKHLVDDKMRKTWSKLVSKTKEKAKDNDEELFCMAYSSFYCNRPVSIHDHPQWDEFIKNLPK
jgi:hypothetical protein